jgi:hypothetical protein
MLRTHMRLGTHGRLEPHLDGHVPVVCEPPHRLSSLLQERRRGATESLIPAHRSVAVADGHSRELPT